jgi:hypothetical protein
VRVRLDFEAVRQTEWHEYATRFFFGGAITAPAGIIAKEFGPVVGGLFLAFPAIFPASATLIEKHEKEKNQKASGGTEPARKAAGIDAEGAARGSLGLIVFALVVWRLLSSFSPILVLPVATAAWMAVSVAIWSVRMFIRGGKSR